MKKQSKKVQLVLVIALIVVWGLVIYRFRKMNNTEDETSEIDRYITPANMLGAQKQDSQALLLNYPDPFLAVNEGAENKKTGIHNISTRRSIVYLPKSGLRKPPVQYRGYSKDKDERNRARLVVSGKNLTIAEGEQTDNLQLISVFRDSVHLVWEGIFFSIKRQR